MMRNSFDVVISKLKIPFDLAPLQKQDVIEAASSGRFLFGYEVGCGKTVVATVTMKMWDSPYNIIICPPIILDQWQDWLSSVGLEDISIYRGPRRTRDMLNHKYVLMSHAIFRDSFEMLKLVYRDKEVTLVVDEAQSMKSASSVLFRNINTFIQPDRNVLMLTATPTSKPEDTYTYMKVKTPTLYRSFGHWQNLHVEGKDYFGNTTSYKNMDLLAANFALRSVKRSKAEVFGDLSEPIYQRMVYELDKKHLKLYERLAEEQLILLDNGQKIDATTAQRLYHALQQIVVNYAKFSGNPKDRSKALDLLDEAIEEVDPMDKSKSKLAVWTYYVSTSELVTEYLQQKLGKHAVVAAYGKVDSRKAVKAIMEDPEVRVLVAQPSSCGVGLNLQHVCWENLFLEMSTTPMQVKQAIGRTWRVGAKHRPTMRFALAKSTIQLALFERLLQNDDLVSKVERTLKTLRQEIFGTIKP